MDFCDTETLLRATTKPLLERIEALEKQVKALEAEAEKIVIAVDETGGKWAVLDGYIDVATLDNAQALVKRLEK